MNIIIIIVRLLSRTVLLKFNLFLTFITMTDFLVGLFYHMLSQLLGVKHSRSPTQSWGSVLPSIVETRDQNSRGCPLLFSNRNLGSFCAHLGHKSYTPTAFGTLWTTPGVRCMKHASS